MYNIIFRITRQIIKYKVFIFYFGHAVVTMYSIPLQTFLYPKLRTSSLEHDSYSCKYYNGVPFPTKRADDYSFVGSHR